MEKKATIIIVLIVELAIEPIHLGGVDKDQNNKHLKIDPC
jgi:hypothetical protein